MGPKTNEWKYDIAKLGPNICMKYTPDYHIIITAISARPPIEEKEGRQMGAESDPGT